MDFQASVGSSLKPKTPGTIAPPCPDHLIALVLSRIGPTCYDVPHNKVILGLEPTAIANYAERSVQMTSWLPTLKLMLGHVRRSKSNPFVAARQRSLLFKICSQRNARPANVDENLYTSQITRRRPRIDPVLSLQRVLEVFVDSQIINKQRLFPN